MPNAILNKRCAGNPYPNIAAQFAAASTQSFSIADNASLSTGDIDFSGCAWVNHSALTAATVYTVATKGAASGQLEWHMRYTVASNAYLFLVSTDGTAATLAASTAGAAVIGAWSFVVWWHDSVANTINVQVNNGTADSTAFTTGATDRTGAFAIGARTNFTGTEQPIDGRIDAVGFWKKVLTAAERTQLYKVGIGMAYRDLSGSLLTNLNGWWDFDGNGLDASGNGNHLTANNGPTFAAGKR